MSKTFLITFIGPSGEGTKRVEATTKEGARKWFRAQFPTCHIVHTHEMEAA